MATKNQKLRVIDTHAHLDFPQYNQDREELIKRTQQEGIDYIINVGTTLAGSRRSIELAKKYDFIYASVAIHPHYAEEIDDQGLKDLEEIASSPKVVAIGETGLDFYKNLSSPQAQEKLFRWSIRCAQKLSLPLIIHSRDAAEDTLRILQEEKGEKLRGVLHCYSYPWPIAEKILQMGFYISVAGQVTFPKSQTLRDVVKGIPPERMLLETDCPFLAPQEFRGKRNEPAYVKYIARELSNIYGLSIKDIALITSQNAKKLFKI
ncbi:MAG: TatD family hydrolase [Candidatus Omnitrophica bacterium]|nr:TatD family hydrolase [Candidatus Omnitrophota bacterium]